MKTPQLPYSELATQLGVSEVYLKREDDHPYGSHKGRSIPLMMKKYLDDGHHDFVISSSGNAALAAILFTANHNKNNPTEQIKLQIFVGKNIDQNKLNSLKSTLSSLGEGQGEVVQTDRPKQTAFQLDKAGKTKNLRQSTDDTALIGYHELAEELNKIENLQAIFIPTSSGTTAQGLGEAFQKLKEHPQIHIVQTDFCHPIAKSFSKKMATNTSSSFASAIVDKIAHRKNQVIKIINQSNGSSWIVSDEEIKSAMDLVKKTCQVNISPNSALSIAGLKKAAESGWKWNGPVVCLITGK